MPSREVYRPPLTLTPGIVSSVGEVMRLLGRVEALPSATPQVRLRKEARVRTVHATLAIEGAGLEEPRVTAILDGRRVAGSPAAVREVKNVILAYERVPELDPGRTKDLLSAHRLLMDGLTPDAGRFRRGGVGVVQGSKVAHVAPPASRVPALIDDLLGFLRRDRTLHTLVKAAVVHYELEFIHPFSDGNGRVGRLWQHRMLRDLHPIFEHVPVESVVHARQAAYYAALGAADRAGEAGPFAESPSRPRVRPSARSSRNSVRSPRPPSLGSRGRGGTSGVVSSPGPSTRGSFLPSRCRPRAAISERGSTMGPSPAGETRPPPGTSSADANASRPLDGGKAWPFTLRVRASHDPPGNLQEARE